jgi:16S rRNA (cytidine1402-2'-O)-methyltransferase
MRGTLYIVATPIGNLEDITIRAIRILSEVDVILAEDTRVTQKLLDFVVSRQSLVSSSTDSKRPVTSVQRLISYHQHSSDTKKLEILKLLMDGKNIALVTDAGTPGISDPGNELVSFILENGDDISVVPIPGSSAVTAALSVSGFDSSKFLFLGFWPKKKASKIVKIIKEFRTNVVFYESPYRILKTLNLLEKELGNNIQILIARELTKLHETIYRGEISVVREILEKQTIIKGEIVIILNLKS